MNSTFLHIHRHGCCSSYPAGVVLANVYWSAAPRCVLALQTALHHQSLPELALVLHQSECPVRTEWMCGNPRGYCSCLRGPSPRSDNDYCYDCCNPIRRRVGDSHHHVADNDPRLVDYSCCWDDDYCYYERIKKRGNDRVRWKKTLKFRSMAGAKSWVTCDAIVTHRL